MVAAMPKQPHVPKYSHHKPTGLGYSRFRRPEGGYDTVYFPGKFGSQESYAAYLAAIGEWRRTGRSPKRQSPEGVTAAQLILRFWDHVGREDHYTKAGRDTDEKHCLRAAFRVLAGEFRDRPTADFGIDEMDHLRKCMVGKGWAERTVKSHLQRVRSLFEWGKDHKLVPESVRLVRRKGLASRVKHRGRVNPPRKPPDPFAVGAVQLVACAPVRAMIWLQVLNGMRPGGVCSVRPRDVDRSRSVWVYAEPPDLAAKTGGERHWLGPRAQAVLGPWLDAAPSPDTRVFRTTLRPGANRTGGFTVDYYRHYVATLCETLGVEHWSPHQLRTLHAVRVEDLYGREAAQKRLGHTNPETTAIYTQSAIGILEKIAREIG
jgi:integrase